MANRIDDEMLVLPAIGRLVHTIDQLTRLKHRQLYAYWDRRRSPDRPLPARADIDPLDIPELLPNVWLTDVVVTDGVTRFRERLVGTALTRLYGKDTTGQMFEEIYAGDHLQRQLATYRAVASSGLPHVSRLRVPLHHREFLIYDRLLLPLARDHRTPDMILGIHAYEAEPGEPDLRDWIGSFTLDVEVAGQRQT